MFGLTNTRLAVKYVGYHELTTEWFSPALIWVNCIIITHIGQFNIHS